MADEKSLERTKRYKKGILEILRTRKYQFIEDQETEKYIDYIAESMEEIGGGSRVVVRIPTKSTVGVQEVRALHKKQEEEGFEEAIIIAEERFTHYAKKEAAELGIEVFESHHPMFNVFTHDLVPLHERLTEKEKREILKQFNIEIHQLPKIKKTDPAVKNINAKPGDVIRILREGLDHETFATYRLVVDDS